MAKDKKIRNALKRSEVHRKDKKEKAQDKLKRRMETRKAERNGELGKELKAARLAKNIPRTQDNTRVYDSRSYLTADPTTLQAAADRAAEASRKINGPPQDADESEESDNGVALDEDEEMPEAGPSGTTAAGAEEEDGDEEEGNDSGPGAEAEEEEEEDASSAQPISTAPPRILITTSPSPSKETYEICDDLRGVFPGGEFFKRPKGKGFEMGRVARWAAKRGYGAMIVVNENHAITLMRLPAGPTAYFRLTGIVPCSLLAGRARPTPHTPELILNNFTTLLGHSVGGLFASLFPPQPQFRGRQVVTLHNQRDFLFFRRHRYAFASLEKAKLQEIGPRFTLKLRWLRKGLPTVTAADGRIPGGGDADDLNTSRDIEDEDQRDEDEAMEEMQAGIKAPKAKIYVPALDQEEEFEWKWTPKMKVSRRTFFL